jgi:hypothetical protein
MTPTAQLHTDYERALAAALRSDDPVAFLHAAAERANCDPALRRILLAACKNESGLRMSALITTRLRFERLLQGSQQANDLFSTDSERFAGLFRAYHQAVTPTAHGPRSEAALFAAWARASGVQS